MYNNIESDKILLYACMVTSNLHIMYTCNYNFYTIYHADGYLALNPAPTACACMVHCYIQLL